MQCKRIENGNLEISIPYILRGISGRKRILAPDTPMESDEPLVLQLARAFRWQNYIDEGRFSNINGLGHAIGVSPNVVAKTTRLTLLSPAIIHKIITGDIPNHLNLARLRCAIPDSWKEQEQMFLQ